MKVICSYLTSVDYQPYLTESYHINQLKSLTRFRDSLVKQRSLQLQSMTNIMDHLFPEFKPFFKNSLKSATAIYLLTSFETPSRIARLNLNSYNKMKSQLHRTISYDHFCELKTLAKNTIGIEDHLRTFQLQACLKLYLEYHHQIQETEQLIEYEFSKVTSHFQTIHSIIKGITLLRLNGQHLCRYTGDIDTSSPCHLRILFNHRYFFIIKRHLFRQCLNSLSPSDKYNIIFIHSRPP